MYADKRKFFRRNRPSKSTSDSNTATMSIVTTDIPDRQKNEVIPTTLVSRSVTNESAGDQPFSFTSSSSETSQREQSSSSNHNPVTVPAAGSLPDVEMSELDTLPIDDEPERTRSAAGYVKDDDMGMTFAITPEDLLVPSLKESGDDDSSTSSAEVQHNSASVSPDKQNDENHSNSYDGAAAVSASSGTSSNHDRQQNYGQTASSTSYQPQETTVSGNAPASSSSSAAPSSATSSSAETTSNSNTGGGVTVGNFAICTNRRRVKLYALNAERHWDDKGTGHVIVTVHNTPAETEAGIEPTLSLLVRDENDGTELLSSRVRLDTSYQRQQETLIVWSEKGSDLALSFQERIGCEDVWAKICEIQGKDPSVEVTQECADDDDEELGLLGGDTGGGNSGMGSGMGGSGSGMGNAGGTGGGGGGGMMSSVSAPLAMRPPTIGNLEAIQKTIKQCMQSPVERERLSIALEQDNYLSRVIDLFHQCEEVDDLHSLYCLYNIVYNILMLNKNALYERVFSEENIDAVLGALEYDPKVCQADPTARKQHRRIVHKDARFREVVPIPNADIRSKIIQTYKVQYIHDIILPTPTVFEDNMLSALSSFLFFNKVEITSQLQEDEVFLQALIDAVLVDDKTAKNPAEVLRTRRDVFAFWKEYCAFSHTLQAGNRDMFYRAMIDQGILKAIEVTIRTCKDTETRSLVLEVFSYLIEFGPQAMIRDYCLSQVQMGSQASSSSSSAQNTPQQYRPLTFGNTSGAGSNFSQRTPPSSQPLSQHYGSRSSLSTPTHSASAAAGSSDSKPNAAATTSHDPNDFDERSLFLNVIIRELVCGGSVADNNTSTDDDSAVDINIVIQLMSVLRVLLDPENMTANMSLGGGGGGGGGQQSTNPKTEFLAFFYRHCIQHLLEPLIKHTETPKHHRAQNAVPPTTNVKMPPADEKSLKRSSSTESLVDKLSQKDAENSDVSKSTDATAHDDDDKKFVKIEPKSEADSNEPGTALLSRSKRSATDTDEDENYVCHEKPYDITADTTESTSGGVEADETFAKSNKKLRMSPKTSHPTSPVSETAGQKSSVSTSDGAVDDSKPTVSSKTSSNVGENQRDVALLRRRMQPLQELLRERAHQAAARLSNGITAAATAAADNSPRQQPQQQQRSDAQRLGASNSNNTTSSSGRRLGSLHAVTSNPQTKSSGQQNQKRPRTNISAASLAETTAAVTSLPLQQYYVVAPRLHTAQLLNQIVELISFCIDHHTFYIKNYVIGKNLLGKVLVLMRSPHMFLVCTALRALRKIVGLNNEFYNRYIQRNDLLRGVIERFLSNGKRYNLFNSAVLELFEHIRQDDNETLGTYVLDRYWDKLKDITYVKTFQELKKKFEKQRFGRTIGGGSGGGIGGGSGVNDSDEEVVEEEDELEDERAGIGGEELDEDDDEEEEDEEEDEEIDENYDDDDDDEEDAAVTLPRRISHIPLGGFGALTSSSTSSPVAKHTFGLVHRQHHSSAAAGGTGSSKMLRKSHQRVESGVAHGAGLNVKSARSAPPLGLSGGGGGNSPVARKSGASAVRHHHHHHPSSQQQQRSSPLAVKSQHQQQHQLTRQLSRDDDDDDEDDDGEDGQKHEGAASVVRLMGTRSSAWLSQNAAATSSGSASSPSKLPAGGTTRNDEKSSLDPVGADAATVEASPKSDNIDDNISQSDAVLRDAEDRVSTASDADSQSITKAAPAVTVTDTSHSSSPSVTATPPSTAEAADNSKSVETTATPTTSATSYRTFFPLSPMAAALAATAAAAAVEHHQRQQQQASNDNSGNDAGNLGTGTAASLQPVTTASSALSASSTSSPSSPTTSILTALANVINTQIDAVSAPVVTTSYSGSSNGTTTTASSSSNHQQQQQNEPSSKLRLTFRRLPTRNVTNKSDSDTKSSSSVDESDLPPLRLSRPFVNGHHQQAHVSSSPGTTATTTAALAFAEEKDTRGKKSFIRQPVHFKPRTTSSSSPLDLRRRREVSDDGDDRGMRDADDRDSSAKKFVKLDRTTDSGRDPAVENRTASTPVAVTDAESELPPVSGSSLTADFPEVAEKPKLKGLLNSTAFKRDSEVQPMSSASISMSGNEDGNES